jgi:hypothetical protein
MSSSGYLLEEMYGVIGIIEIAGEGLIDQNYLEFAVLFADCFPNLSILSDIRYFSFSRAI